MKHIVFDKSKWKKIKIGDIAEDISVRVDNPSESEFERFVGLEHFISGDLKITNWSTTENLVSSTKAFKSGDILFARRNAYLRRASLVEFDGVCSGDAFVLRENHNKIVPGFLSFVVNSERLWDYANANAAGTMSKRVKWRDLSNFEFYLPPLEQQNKLAELLWALEKYLQSLIDLKLKAAQAYEVRIRNILSSKNMIKNKLEDICNKPISYGIVQPGPIVENGVPYIQSSDIKNKRVEFDKLGKTSNEISANYSRTILEEGDIILSLRGNIGEAAVVNGLSGPLNIARGVARISLTPAFDSKLLCEIINSTFFRSKILESAQGSTFKEIAIKTLRELEISIPEKPKDRVLLLESLETYELIKSKLHFTISSSVKLKSHLINSLV